MENDLKGNENYFELTGGSSYRVNSLSKTDTFGTDPNFPS